MAVASTPESNHQPSESEPADLGHDEATGDRLVAGAGTRGGIGYARTQGPQDKQDGEKMRSDLRRSKFVKLCFT